MQFWKRDSCEALARTFIDIVIFDILAANQPKEDQPKEGQPGESPAQKKYNEAQKNVEKLRKAFHMQEQGKSQCLRSTMGKDLLLLQHIQPNRLLQPVHFHYRVEWDRQKLLDTIHCQKRVSLRGLREPFTATGLFVPPQKKTR